MAASFGAVPAMAGTELSTTRSVYEKQAKEIQRIEEYLTNITTLTADFTQVAPDGSVSTGKFYLKRPGRMRWQYDPPTPLLIISDGSVLTYFDYELEQVSKLPMDSSMIGFLARENVEFKDSVTVEHFEAKDGAVRVSVAQVEKPDEGKLMFEFADKPLELRNLVITDANGNVTNVALSNLKFGTQLDKKLFIFRDPRKRRRT